MRDWGPESGSRGHQPLVEPGLMLAMIFLACTEPGVWPVSGPVWAEREKPPARKAVKIGELVFCKD